MLSEDLHYQISEDWQECPTPASLIVLSTSTLSTDSIATGQPNVTHFLCGCARKGSLVPDLGLLLDYNEETSLLNAGKKVQSDKE